MTNASPPSSFISLPSATLHWLRHMGGAEVSVFIALCAHRDFATNVTSVGKRRLTQLADLSDERYVTKAIKSLIDRGLVTELQTGHAGRGGRYAWRINFDCPPPADNTGAAPVFEGDNTGATSVLSGEIPAQETRCKDGISDQIPAQGRHSDPNTGATTVFEEGNTGAQTPALDRYLEPNTGAGTVFHPANTGATSVLSGEIPALGRHVHKDNSSFINKDKGEVLFEDSPTRAGRHCIGIGPEEIYAAYPRKVAKSEALLAIGKSVLKLRERSNVSPDGTPWESWLLARVKLYAEARRRGDKANAQGTLDFWPAAPHPATWFNKGRYDDDPAEWEPKPKPKGINKRLSADQRGEFPEQTKSIPRFDLEVA